jgi:hypothetical protein
MSRYLEFAKSGIETLIERQSMRAGGKPGGALCITVSHAPCRACLSMGSPSGDSYLTYPVRDRSVETEPSRLDLTSWPALELYSDVTGNPKPKEIVTGMAEVLVEHGFDPASGLGYFGAQADLDVVRLAPMPSGFTFKPAFGIPLARLWTLAPAQTARMIRSAYYGLITRPETMDYNRYCSYGWDDSQGEHVTPFDSGHVAFAYTGASLIHWWGYAFVRTGDRDCLARAQAMADKWEAAQHPQTGLMPAWFGADRGDLDTMPPRPYLRPSDAMAGVFLLQAAEEWRQVPEGANLADQLRGMGERLLVGLGRYGYDAETRTFPQWVNLDGSIRKEITWYTFYSQEQKDEAVRRDPILEDVEVFAGDGFYRARQTSVLTGCSFAYHVAVGAMMTGHEGLRARVREFADIAMEEASKLNSEFNELGQWTYPATSHYIKMLLLLFGMTNEGQHLDRARQLADRELEFLSRPLPEGQPEWWRLPARNLLLEAMLLLHQAAYYSGQTLSEVKSQTQP